MKISYDVLLFDLKGFGLLSEDDQYRIMQKVKSLKDSYDFEQTPYYENYTGDGYYIGIRSSKKSYLILLKFITLIMNNIEEVYFRYALNVGIVREQLTNERMNIYGTPMTEVSRLIDSTKAGNIVLVTENFYIQYISGKKIDEKVIDGKSKLITVCEKKYLDKHKRRYIGYQISYYIDKIYYGLTIPDTSSSKYAVDKSILTHKDFRRILKLSWNNREVNVLEEVNPKNSGLNIYYSLLSAKLSPMTQELYIFLKNPISKIKFVEHFIENKKYDGQICLCANKAVLDEKTNIHWKTDLINKIKKKSREVGNNIFFYFLDDFIWERIIPDSLKKKEYFSNEKDYINPSYSFSKLNVTSLSTPKNKIIPIDTFLKTIWLFQEYSPICAIIGPGGIGKTTVIREFAEQTQNDPNINKTVLYIDGNSLAQEVNNRLYDREISKIETVVDLIDFYFLSIEANPNLRPVLDSRILQYTISFGNIIIIVDGLDEIASVLGDRFSLNNFIIDILNINKLVNHTKILITSRDYYWENLLLIKNNIEITEKMSIISIEGFNDNMVEKYFQKKFEDESTVKKAIEMLNTFSKKSENMFIPFITYIVSDLISKSEANLQIQGHNSKYLDQNIEFENIILNVCGREIIRQELNCEIDDLLDIFREIIFEHKGQMKTDDFNEYLRIARLKIKKGYISKIDNFLSNPLLQKRNNIVTMAFDFVQDHLTAGFFKNIFQNTSHTKAICDKLATYSDGKNKQINDIALRISKTENPKELFTKYFNSVLKPLRKNSIKTKNVEGYRKAISTLLYMAFILFPKENRDKTSRMDFLRILYGNDLNQIHIFGEFYPLNFSSCKIINSTFYNYNNFVKCSFNIYTVFENCRINLKDNGSSDIFMKNINRDMFVNCDLNGQMISVIDKSLENSEDHKAAIKKDLYMLFKTFYPGGRHSYKREEHLQFATNSIIDWKNLYRDIKREGFIDDNTKSTPYNIGINRTDRESVVQLINNNSLNIRMTRLLEYLFNKYYK